MGGAENLVKLYGCWIDANDIPFDDLPSSFVLKGNNGSGSNIIVSDKSKIDIPAVRRQLNKWIHTTIGLYSAELQYMHIEPRIIAEELLPIEEGAISIIDYKIWCFNGKAEYIWVCSDRDNESFLYTDVMTYDREWNAHPEYSRFDKHYRKGKVLPKPNNLQDLLTRAEQLAAGFPCVRVDLYNIKGKVYFGEMTFTSDGGMMDYFTDEFLLLAGSRVNLPQLE